jgi:hypothetical protein
LVFSDTVGNVAEFRGANAGESHGNKQQKNVAAADVVRKFEQLWALGGFGDESKIGCGIAYLDGHGNEMVVVEKRE